MSQKIIKNGMALRRKATSAQRDPVLKKEVLEYLNPQSNENFIDCTTGLGGHTLSILEKNIPNGKLLCIETDPGLYRLLKKKFSSDEIKQRVILINDSYVHLKNIVKQRKFKNISGILLDLGMSTWHLKESGKGFSFIKDELLDMRYNSEYEKNALTAIEIINTWPPKAIEQILDEYGEEKFFKKIVQEIVNTRKQKTIETTLELVNVIKRATPKWYQNKKKHPATKTFQALRITVNDELNNINSVLPQALDILMPKGKLAVISFHSLEDRIVKNFFKKQANKNQIKILTKKPIRPNLSEIKSNPSSRSARLRVAIKT